MTSRLPRSASAESRSATPANRTSSRLPCARTACTQWSRPRPDSRDPLARSVFPGANRVSGSSVRTSTTTSPVMPCAFTTRPTVKSTKAPRGCASLLVGVHHVDADAAAADAGDQGAQRGRGASAPTDHLAQIVRMHVHLDGPTTPTGHQVNPHVVGVVDDSPDQVLDGVDDDTAHRAGQLSVAGSACSPPAPAWSGSAACSGSVAFFPAAFFAGDFFF